MVSITSSQSPKNLTRIDSKDGNLQAKDKEGIRGQTINRDDDKDSGTVGGRRAPGTYHPKSQEILSLSINSDGLEAHIQYMKDHALIAKFVGFWPMEKDLIWWINHHWKPKGGYELHLGAKGFFTVVFYSL